MEYNHVRNISLGGDTGALHPPPPGPSHDTEEISWNLCSTLYHPGWKGEGEEEEVQGYEIMVHPGQHLFGGG